MIGINQSHRILQKQSMQCMINMAEFNNSSFINMQVASTSGMWRRPVSMEQGQTIAPSLPPLEAQNLLESQQLDLEEKDDDEQLDEHLVEEVHRYRILWDTSSRGYKDTVKKNQAWKEISLKLNRNGVYDFVNPS